MSLFSLNSLNCLEGYIESYTKKQLEKICFFIFEIYSLLLTTESAISLGVNYTRNCAKLFKFMISFNFPISLRNR